MKVWLNIARDWTPSGAIGHPRLIVLGALLTFASWWAAGAQNGIHADQAQLYSRAKIYLADPSASLEKQVPDLRA